MGVIVGKRARAADSVSADRVPATRNRWRFYWMAHPWKWDWSPEDHAAGNSGWLPSLGRMNIIPGVGGVSPEGNPDLAVVANQRSGWTVIVPSDARLGEYMHYTQQFPTRGKIAVWASIFDSVNIVGNRAVWGHDDEGFRVFRRFLIDAGIVADITSDVRNAIVDLEQTKLEGKHGRLSSNPNNPGLAGRIQIAEKRLAQMTGPLAAELVAPSPAKRKPRQRKSDQ